MASVDDTRRLEELTKNLEQRTTWQGRAVRGLRVLGEDNRLLLTVSRGEFNLNGFRNRDLQRLLYRGQAADTTQRKRGCAAMSRKWRMLRAHGLIKKVPHTHRYLLTLLGRRYGGPRRLHHLAFRQHRQILLQLLIAGRDLPPAQLALLHKLSDGVEPGFFSLITRHQLMNRCN